MKKLVDFDRHYRSFRVQPVSRVSARSAHRAASNSWKPQFPSCSWLCDRDSLLPNNWSRCTQSHRRLRPRGTFCSIRLFTSTPMSRRSTRSRSRSTTRSRSWTTLRHSSATERQHRHRRHADHSRLGFASRARFRPTMRSSLRSCAKRARSFSAKPRLLSLQTSSPSACSVTVRSAGMASTLTIHDHCRRVGRPVLTWWDPVQDPDCQFPQTSLQSRLVLRLRDRS